MNDWVKTVSIRNLFLMIGGLTALRCAFALVYAVANKGEQSKAPCDVCSGRRERIGTRVDDLPSFRSYPHSTRSLYGSEHTHA